MTAEQDPLNPPDLGTKRPAVAGQDGGVNREPPWDEARVALGRVAELFNRIDDPTLDQLRDLENYNLIPQPVREILEGLSHDERQFMRRLFITLWANHFYTENAVGGLGIPY